MRDKELQAPVPRQALVHEERGNAIAKVAGDPLHGATIGELMDERVIIFFVGRRKDPGVENRQGEGRTRRALKAVTALPVTKPRVDVKRARRRAGSALAGASHGPTARGPEREE